MRIYQFDTLSDGLGGSEQPLRLDQKFSHSHRRVRAAALAGAGALICAPFALILTNPTASTEFLHLFVHNPLTALQLAIVGMLGLAAAGVGLGELLQPVIRERLLTIDGTHAIVEDKTRSGITHWQEPLRAFKGIRHRVQTRSSGPVHTLMLEHKNSARCLCIAYETRINNQAIVEAGRRFNLPILTNSERSDRARGLKWLPSYALNWGRPPTTETQAAGT